MGYPCELRPISVQRSPVVQHSLTPVLLPGNVVLVQVVGVVPVGHAKQVLLRQISVLAQHRELRPCPLTKRLHVLFSVPDGQIQVQMRFGSGT